MKTRLTTMTFLMAVLALTPALAGELTVSWQPSNDQLTAGYDVEILDAQGELIRTLDAGDSTRLVVTDLTDGEIYKMRLRPYDRSGNRARKPSRTMVTMASPRIDAVQAPAPAPGLTAEITLRGANFQEGARLVTRRPDLAVLEQTVVDHQLMVALVSASAQGDPVTAGDFLVVNPVPLAAEYFRVHPEVLDVDQSGTIDDGDVQRVEGALGRKAGDPGFVAALDLNGDGVTDGDDTAILRSALALEYGARNRAP